MLEYENLKSLAEKQKCKFNRTLPNCSYKLAQKIGISVKLISEYVWEYAGSELNCPAFLARADDGYIIYYDEKNCYKNYFVMHEIAHYLLKHNKDDELQELEANVLSCLLICDAQDLIKSSIFDSESISLYYNIPVDTAQEYYQYLLNNDSDYCQVKFDSNLNKNNNTCIEIQENQTLFGPRKKSILINIVKLSIAFFVGTVVSVTAFTLLHRKDINNHNNYASTTTNKNVSTAGTPVTTNTYSEITTKEISSSQKKVVLTPAGSKYHNPDCYHVRGKEGLIELTVQEAIDAGFGQCSICKPN